MTISHYEILNYFKQLCIVNELSLLVDLRETTHLLLVISKFLNYLFNLQKLYPMII